MLVLIKLGHVSFGKLSIFLRGSFNRMLSRMENLGIRPELLEFKSRKWSYICLKNISKNIKSKNAICLSLLELGMRLI